MTKEQMELLLDYIDAKLQLPIAAATSSYVTGREIDSVRERVKSTRAKMLATFDPPPEEPKEEEAYWQIILKPDLKDLGRTFDPTQEFASLPQVKQIVSAGQDPMTHSVMIRYLGHKLEGATEWLR